MELKENRKENQKDRYKMDNPKTIGNVNFLNLVNATPESVAGIRHIDNINVAVYTPDTVSLLYQMNPSNVNATIEIPTGANMVMKTGQMLVNADFFKNVERKIYLFVTGQLIIEPGIPLEEIEKGLAGIAVTGQFFCPEDLMGVVNTRPNTIIGQSIAYPPFKRFVNADLRLEVEFLNSLADGTALCVLGDLLAPKVLSNELLERKIGRIFVSGDVICHEENAQALQAKLYKSSGNFETVPAGFVWVEKPLVLDRESLDYLPGKQLFCKELVCVAVDVDPAVLDRQVDSLIAKDLLLSPVALKPVVAKKCRLFDTKAIFYTDELWLVQDDQTWETWRFDNLNGTATLVVTGELTIDPAILPAVISAAISKIHNFGQINCSAEQRAAIETRLITREGEIKVKSKDETPAEEARPDFIGNINMLTL
jgi:hypothetical protein